MCGVEEGRVRCVVWRRDGLGVWCEEGRVRCVVWRRDGVRCVV